MKPCTLCRVSRVLQKNLRRVEDEALASRKALEPINAWRKRAATVERIRMVLFVLLTFLVLALLLTQVA